jgi:hypothetical protein
MASSSSFVKFGPFTMLTSAFSGLRSVNCDYVPNNVSFNLSFDSIDENVSFTIPFSKTDFTDVEIEKAIQAIGKCDQYHLFGTGLIIRRDLVDTEFSLTYAGIRNKMHCFHLTLRGQKMSHFVDNINIDSFVGTVLSSFNKRFDLVVIGEVTIGGEQRLYNRTSVFVASKERISKINLIREEDLGKGTTRFHFADLTQCFDLLSGKKFITRIMFIAEELREIQSETEFECQSDDSTSDTGTETLAELCQKLDSMLKTFHSIRDAKINDSYTNMLRSFWVMNSDHYIQLKKLLERCLKLKDIYQTVTSNNVNSIGLQNVEKNFSDMIRQTEKCFNNIVKLLLESVYK